MTNSTDRQPPFADSAMAKYLDKQFDSIKNMKTEAEIAAEIWLDDPKWISKFRRGEVIFPLDRISLLAMAINATSAQLFRLSLEQHWPGMQETILECLGIAIATPREERLLSKWRAATDNMDPAWTPAIERAVDRMIAEVKASRSTT